MILERLVNTADRADAASCVPQALAGRRVGVVREFNAWDATLSPVRERWDPVVGPGQWRPKQPIAATLGP
jgi:hypothetical protein